jgi:hypothetical protein
MWWLGLDIWRKLACCWLHSSAFPEEYITTVSYYSSANVMVDNKTMNFGSRDTCLLYFPQRDTHLVYVSFKSIAS